MKRLLAAALIAFVLILVSVLPQVAYAISHEEWGLTLPITTSLSMSKDIPLLSPVGEVKQLNKTDPSGLHDSGELLKHVVPDGGLTALLISSGIKLNWSPVSGVLGYRIFRSEQPGEEGIPITDFPMNVTSFADVSVDANTTYYYTLRTVLGEANITGAREQRGDPTEQISVTTGAEILGGDISGSEGKFKNVILMRINETSMSVNGSIQGIDPGRDTTPQIHEGRALLPIRAVIEAMGGVINWEEETGQITIRANEHIINMWLGQNNLVADGETKLMDVAPVSMNGRTMVPVRFAAENVGCAVEWIPSTSEIVIVYYSLW